MVDEIKKVLTRNVEAVVSSKGELGRLMKKRQIRLYAGIDPTTPNIHLGNAVVLRKLKEFQDLGHEVILLVGNFTAQIGDPSDRKAPRRPLTLTQIKENMATYKEQASKILDFSKTKFVYNADWLAKLKFEELAEFASHVPAKVLLDRKMFKLRLQKGRPLWVSEFLYPLLQAYDSVHLNVDLEIGAKEQYYNMFISRDLHEVYKKRKKFILMVKLLEGPDGRKMSKSLGNTIDLTDPPNEMYGKLMSLKDELVAQYFELCTDLPLEKIKKLMKEAKKDPMEVKKQLAHEIVKMYHGEKKANEAEKEFEKTFQKRGLPASIPQVKIAEKKLLPADLLVKCKLASSKSEARRLIEQGGVEINGKRLAVSREPLAVSDGMTIKVGKRRFVKISH